MNREEQGEWRERVRGKVGVSEPTRTGPTNWLRETTPFLKRVKGRRRAVAEDEGSVNIMDAILLL